MKRALAYANTNIALVKYWGKSNNPFNIPAVSSLSMTLNDLGTRVTLSQIAGTSHEIFIEGRPAMPKACTRVMAYLEQVREIYGFFGCFHIDSHSTVPYAAGIASSASFFAALAKALDHILDLGLSLRDQSILARMGSGSAARSMFCGFSALYGGSRHAHEDAYASGIAAHSELDLHMIMAVIDDQQKPISSRDAMDACKKTSPFFQAFVDSHDSDFTEAVAALNDGSFATLGAIMEHSTLKMFATMWSAQPAINFWQPNSLAVIDLIYRLRREHGPIAYFTMDAGPNVKILCRGKDLPLIVKTVAESKLTLNISCFVPGLGAHLVNGPTHE